MKKSKRNFNDGRGKEHLAKKGFYIGIKVPKKWNSVERYGIKKQLFRRLATLIFNFVV